MNCLTCKHNTYLWLDTDWVSCGHPITLAKTPKWSPGDPAFVTWRTADLSSSDVAKMGECPTYEPATMQITPAHEEE